MASNDTQLSMTVYPGLGYPVGDDWLVSVSGLAFRTPIVFTRRQRIMIRMLGNVMRATPGELRSDTFITRINPFMAEASKRIPVSVYLGDREFPIRKRTRKNGRFEETLLVPGDLMDRCRNGSRVDFRVCSQKNDRVLAQGQVHLFPQRGLSVISDIDDTIKHSQVSDKRALLVNTFLREFRGIEGMAELYRQWHQEGLAFHYVSSSPWQLFDALQSINTVLGFPAGTMHLRNFRLRDQLLKKLIIERKGKAVEIQKLLLAMPQRQFILIGDSGEKDPKIYRKVCRQFPQQISGVFIRNLPEQPLDTERFEKLHDALPDGICAVYESAEELADLARPLIAD